MMKLGDELYKVLLYKLFTNSGIVHRNGGHFKPGFFSQGAYSGMFPE